MLGGLVKKWWLASFPKKEGEEWCSYKEMGGNLCNNLEIWGTTIKGWRAECCPSPEI